MNIQQIEKDFLALVKASDFEGHIFKMKVSIYNVLGLYLYKRKPKGGVLQNIYYTKKDIPMDEVRPTKEIFKEMKIMLQRKW